VKFNKPKSVEGQDHDFKFQKGNDMHLGSSYGVQNVNIDISINNQKFYMSKKIVSPPNEEEKIVAAVHQNWGCV
jgi:hypothetical protein